MKKSTMADKPAQETENISSDNEFFRAAMTLEKDLENGEKEKELEKTGPGKEEGRKQKPRRCMANKPPLAMKSY